MSGTHLRLDVWRPARLERPIVQVVQVQHGSLRTSPLQHECLHEQIYSWKITDGDIFTALVDDAEAKEIKRLLIEDFRHDTRPEERGFGRLKDVVQKIDNYLNDVENRQWQEWTQPLGEEDDQEDTYRAQPMLIFNQHLKWLCDVFGNIPGASVTLR